MAPKNKQPVKELTTEIVDAVIRDNYELAQVVKNLKLRVDRLNNVYERLVVFMNEIKYIKLNKEPERKYTKMICKCGFEGETMLTPVNTKDLGICCPFCGNVEVVDSKPLCDSEIKTEEDVNKKAKHICCGLPIKTNEMKWEN